MVLAEDIKRILEDSNISWSRLVNSTVLVTGATGLIGSLCVKVLLSLDMPIRVCALVRDEERAKKMLGERVCYIVSDVRTMHDIDCTQIM